MTRPARLTALAVSDFKAGDRVRYVPHHVRVNSFSEAAAVRDPDCENGVVSSVGVEFVFVRYYAKVYGKYSAALKHTAQATDPADLIKLAESA